MIAWLRIDDTNIHYPIMQGKDNERYKTHDWQDCYSTMGSVFLDYRNKADFSEDVIKIYGKTNNDGIMLSDILKFEDTEYFWSHQEGVIFIPGGEIELEVIAYIDAKDLTDYSVNEVMGHAKHWNKPRREGKLIFITALGRGKTLVCSGQRKK